MTTEMIPFLILLSVIAAICMTLIWIIGNAVENEDVAATLSAATITLVLIATSRLVPLL